MGNCTALKLMGIHISIDLFPRRIGHMGQISLCLPLHALDGDQHLMSEAAATSHVITDLPISSYYENQMKKENTEINGGLHCEDQDGCNGAR